MKQTITDLVKSDKPALKSIFLKRCLKDSKQFSFKLSEFEPEKGYHEFLQRASKITRVTSLTDYHDYAADERDVILADGCLFLGKWNDGVVVA